MITKITDKNSAKYNALFQDAQNALPDNGGEIYDLHSYFANIADLGALIATDETAIRYIILPLDEDPIHIDANSRKIEIDKSDYFKKNGAGVAKDHTAEIVYFEIDRYFDNVDLAEQDITIEWKNPNNSAGVDAAWPVDIYSKADKIIFGWALTEEITEVAGKVQFAIRFSAENERKETIYSFSTQPADILINKGIDLNADDFTATDVDTVKNHILQRLKNSTSINPNIHLKAPEFFDGFNFDKDIEKKYNIVNDDGVDTDPNSYVQYFEAGVSPANDTEIANNQGAVIKYALYRKDNRDSTNWIEIDDKEHINDNTYIPTRDVVSIPGKKYYKQIPDTNTYAETDVFTTECFERVASVKITTPGVYKVQAHTRKSNVSSEKTDSAEAWFPYPVKPTVLTEEEQSAILEKGSVTLHPTNLITLPDDGQLICEWDTGDTSSDLTVTQSGTYEVIRVGNKLNNEIAYADKSITYRVTPHADDIVLNYETNAINSDWKADYSLTVKITTEKNNAYDSVDIVWYNQQGEEIGRSQITQSNDAVDLDVKGQGSSFTAKAIIHLNGTESSEPREIATWK